MSNIGTEYIEYSQVQEGAREILRNAKIMEDIFNSVNGSMKNMTSDQNFLGVARDTLQAEFAPFSAQFANYVETVTNFAKLFGAAETELSTTESEITKAVEQI